MKQDKTTLLFFASIVLVLVAIMGFVTLSRQSKITSNSYEAEIESIRNQSESTEVSDIEKDLSQTDLENIDQELGDIDREITDVYQ